MKNIKQNNLSMKKLQAQIDAMKSNNTTNKDGGNIEIKIRKGFFGLPLFLITTLLTNLHKIPFISRLTNVLSLWYGKTTWWRMLVITRKIFVAFNALVGIITVIIVSGFSMDNIIAGISGIGITYAELVTSFFSRLYSWFHNFFDNHTPKPKDPGNWWSNSRDPRVYKPSLWSSSPTHPDGPGSPNNIGRYAMDIGKKLDLSVNVNKSTDWNISSWLWYGGIIVITIGTIYLGYMIYQDPTIISPFRQGRVAGAPPIFDVDNPDNLAPGVPPIPNYSRRW